MKVLKSGIEMTPQQLRKAKGGYCACYCDGSYPGDGDVVATVPTDADTCSCKCELDGLEGSFRTAVKYSSHPLP